jgi:hypothetical protein
MGFVRVAFAHRDLPSCSTGRNDAKRAAAFYVSDSKAAVPLTAQFRMLPFNPAQCPT